MHRSIFVRTATAALLLTAIPSCAFVNDLVNDLFGSSHGGPADADALVSSIEQVYVDSEVAKDRVQAAMVALQTVTSPDFQGDVVTAYGELSVLIERSEKQQEELAASVEEMKESAEPVFDQWTKNLEAFTNPTMRQRSQARFAATRRRYEAVVHAVDPAEKAYASVNQNLRDHALFLSQDLNPASVAEIQGDVGELTKAAAELDSRFDRCLVTARTYVDSAALPTRAFPASTQARGVPVRGEQSVAL